MFKKLRLFRTYSKAIKANKLQLEKQFGLRIDGANRLYTVINIPEEIIGEAYALKKSDIDRISENFLREYTQLLSKFMNSLGLTELYEVYEIRKVDKYSYLVVFGFRLFKSNKFFNRLYYIFIPSVVIISTILFLIFF